MLRLAHTDTELEADTAAEESVTVAEACIRLGCDPSTVYALLDAGELTGHRVGKCRQGAAPRGVRVHAVAIRHYKARHAIAPTGTPAAEVARRTGPSHRQALAKLRGLGVV